MNNIAEKIADQVGRSKIQHATGVSKSAVTNAVKAGVFPARWYPAVRDICNAANVACPDDAFTFAQVEGV